MRFTTVMFAAICLFGQALAQSPISAVVPRDYDGVRQYLVLSEAQVMQLKQLQEARQRADQAIYEQMRQRQMQLDQLLAQGSTDAAAIGQLMVEINGLRKQLPGSGKAFRPQALAILTQQQKEKLPQLEEALRTQRPASEAVALNLIDYPYAGDVRILPWPGAAEPAMLSHSAHATAVR